MGEVGHLLGQHRVVDAGAVDVHADLAQVGPAGDRRHRRAGDGLRETVHEEPPDRHLGTLVVKGGKAGGPVRLVGQGHIDLALDRAGAVECQCTQVQWDKRNTRKQNHHNGDPYPVFDTQ